MSVEATRWAFGVSLTDGKVLEGGRAVVVPAVNRRMVLVCLAWHANRAGLAWPSRAVLLRESTLLPHTLKRATRSLVDDGLLVRVTRPGRSSMYRLGTTRGPLPGPHVGPYKDKESQ